METIIHVSACFFKLIDVCTAKVYDGTIPMPWLIMLPLLNHQAWDVAMDVLKE